MESTRGDTSRFPCTKRPNTEALLALEDGSLFRGHSIGAEGVATGEVVFNTAMTGYQEILTDPSYCRQIVALTHPHVGNTGVNPEDEESRGVFASGLVVRDAPALASNWRSHSSLGAFLERHGVVGIAGIDTRRLTRRLREKGALAGAVVAGSGIDEQAAVAAARAFPGLAGMDLAEGVSVEEPYEWTAGPWTGERGFHAPGPDALPWRVVAYDFGVKRNILRTLASRGDAGSRWCRPALRRGTCGRSLPMVSSSRTAPETRSPAATPSNRSGRSSDGACRCSASASATSCSRSRAGRPR